MRNKRGLTIIEVVVVLFLIVLLYMLFLPQIHDNSQRRLAYSILCSHNLKSLGLAYLMYCEDNDRNSIQIKEISEQGKWITELGAYYSEMDEILKCRAAQNTRTDGKEYGGPKNAYMVTLEKEGSNISMESSYGINSWIYNPAPNSNIISGYPAENFWRTNNNQNAAQIPVFADSMWVGGFPEPNGIAGQPPAENGQWDSIDAAMKHFCIGRHNSRTNVVFMDGHVGMRMELKDLWKLKWHKNFDTEGPWTKPDAAWPEWLKSLK